MSRIKKVIIYQSLSNKKPFIEWQSELDNASKAVIMNRIDRVVETGNFGDCKPIATTPGLWELRIHYGPGYRIYFGKRGLELIVFILGGDKSTQTKDINKAKKYWEMYTKDNL